MKGSAGLVTGSLRASAHAVGGMAVRAWALPSLRASAHAVGGMAVRAWALPSGVSARANTSDKSGLNMYLHVTPTEPQQLVWLVPQVGIDYYVSTSTGLKWQIK